MKKIVSAAVVAAMMTSTIAANAAVVVKDYPSLAELQSNISAGTKYERYAGVVRETDGGLRILPASGNFLFTQDLEAGTVLPRVADAMALIRAAGKDQKVVVASNDDGVIELCFPVLAEIAEQNAVPCNYLINHIAVNSDEDSELGNGVRQLAATEAQLNALREAVAAAQAEAGRISAELMVAKAIADRLKMENEELSAMVADLEMDLAVVTAARDMFEMDLKISQAAVAGLTDDVERLTSERDEAMANHAAALNTIAGLNADVAYQTAATVAAKADHQADLDAFSMLIYGVGGNSAESIANGINAYKSDTAWYRDRLTFMADELGIANHMFPDYSNGSNAIFTELSDKSQQWTIVRNHIRGVFSNVGEAATALGIVDSEWADLSLNQRAWKVKQAINGKLSELATAKAELAAAIAEADNFEGQLNLANATIAANEVDIDALEATVAEKTAEIAALQAAATTAAGFTSSTGSAVTTQAEFDAAVTAGQDNGEVANIQGFVAETTNSSIVQGPVTTTTNYNFIVANPNSGSVAINDITIASGNTMQNTKTATFQYNGGNVVQISNISGESTSTMTFLQATDSVIDVIQDAVSSAIKDAYGDGYNDGYADGYADGFADGVASVQ